MSGKPTYEELVRRLDQLEGEAQQWRETERSLRESNEIVNRILATSATGIGLIENRTIDRVNTAMIRLFGYDDPIELIGKSVQTLYPSREAYESIGRIIYEALKMGQTAQLDTEFQRRDGSTFLGHLKASAPDPSLPFRRTTITISDISWRKHAENERVEKEKLQGVIELAGAVCHELNQPIQIAIFEYAKIMGMEGIVAHPMTDTLRKLKAQLDRMRHITAKLMQITRYRTREYICGDQIVDIDRATNAGSNDLGPASSLPSAAPGQSENR
ncbi:MAG: PAS domain S-box protein [Desulfobacterales bacterium]|nr:PAS domain S-box protein [Desulfobacterales bacterium]